MKLSGLLDDNGKILQKQYITYLKEQNTLDELKYELLHCGQLDFANYGPHPELCDALKFAYCTNFVMLKVNIIVLFSLYLLRGLSDPEWIFASNASTANALCLVGFLPCFLGARR